MELSYKRNWIEQLWKIPGAGAVLVLVGLMTPASAVMESGVYIFLWYFGFWFLSVDFQTDFGMPSDFFNPPYDGQYMIIGGVTIVILVSSLILMGISANNARNEKNHKITSATSLFGGIMAIIGIGVYYGYLNAGFQIFWILFDPSFGFYLPLVGGIVGIIGGIAAAYASSIKSKFPEHRLKTDSVFKPQAVNTPTIDKGSSFQSQHETPIYCGNCGEKLIGPFCKACGTKAEL
ncbi:MAG: hypothetical protein ACW98D_03725 [Promethearchaeota archaeon]|jgi:hypothetical protein